MMAMSNAGVTEFTRSQTRAELRRAFVEFKRSQRYEKSGFIDLSSYVGVRLKANKYMPHMGKKEKGIIDDNAT